MVFSGDDTSFAGVMTALENVFAGAIRRKMSMQEILSAIPGTMDISKEEWLLRALEELDAKGQIRLPSRKGRGWQKFGILPLYVTLVRANEDRASRTRKRTLARIREQSPWEPTQMAAFAHTLTTEKQLTLARAINHYLLNRKKNLPLLPHRERALQIFGNEKALDSYVHTGLFSGRITLADLDCFYCPEPLPYEVFSEDREKTGHLPLLVVENSATYWSCTAANQAAPPPWEAAWLPLLYLAKDSRPQEPPPSNPWTAWPTSKIKPARAGYTILAIWIPQDLPFPNESVKTELKTDCPPSIRPKPFTGCSSKKTLQQDMTDPRKGSTTLNGPESGWAETLPIPSPISKMD